MYTVDVNADEPIMLLNKQIGMSYNEAGEWDGTPYIDGAQFQEELMWLDTMGKKRIQVWLCSEGGNVLEAMKICTAILKSKTPVDTYNTGLCASAAAFIFMCGRKRVMSDYASYMIHPVEGGTDQSRAVIQSNIASLTAANCTIPQATIEYMMNCTTWMSSSDCFNYGICTAIETTKESNKKYMPSDTKARLAYCNKLTDDTIKTLKPITMDFKKITNKLNLVDGSNEEVILSAINKLDTDKTIAETNLAEAQRKVTDLQNKLDEATEELKTAKEATEAAKKETEEAEITTKATEMVNSFKAKLCTGAATDAVILTKWVNKAKVDFDGTKELLEAIPLNKTATRVTVDGKGNAPQKVTAQSIMNEVKNRLKL